mmetsp:Transcript_2331/g.5547  ORF Transcript_2331/g.5547 Transcript_2331/m.5547 type:complete len:213 (+) Transcript_2331:41-679(+)
MELCGRACVSWKSPRDSRDPPLTKRTKLVVAVFCFIVMACPYGALLTDRIPSGAYAKLGRQAWPSSGGSASSQLPAAQQSQLPQLPAWGQTPFSDPHLTLEEIADQANALQQQIDENAGREKAELRAAMEAKHREVDQHSQVILRHAVQSIEARKASQLQLAERQRAQKEAAIRHEAEESKRLIDQEMRKALAALGASHHHQMNGSRGLGLG